jgi:hypothetical protein
VRVTVYDKSGDSGADNPLPNVGREAHAYLHHIVGRYDTLADITVFAQGKPFDHVPDLHKILRGLADGLRKVTDFEWLGFVLDWDDPDGARLYQNWTKNPERHPLPLGKFHKKLFGEACPERVLFYPGAHFMVTASCVRSRPRAFFEKALKLSENFPDAAHCFERCWNRVFRVPGIPEGTRWQDLPVYTKPIRRLMGPSPA